MFNNIGGQIKVIARVLFWLGILGSFGLAFYFLYVFGNAMNVFGGDGSIAIVIFVAIAFIGVLTSWISTTFLYGFGQLVENSDKLVELNKTNKDDQNFEI